MLGETITNIDVTVVSCPMQKHFGGSNYGKDRRSTVIVTVETDSGVTGRTYSGDFGDVGEEKLGRFVTFIREDLAPIVEGESPFAIESHWESMFAGSKRYLSFQPADRFLYVHAVGAVDTALWDTIGKALDAPLYKLWGGYQDSLPIISTGGYYEDGKTLDDLVTEAEVLRELGFCGIKMKVGKVSVERDLERLAALREGIGDDFVIGCDANQGYSIEQAVAFARGAKDYDLRWFEEPVAWYDQYQGMREVRQRTGVPVTAGQSELSASGCRRLIEEDAVDIINFDASWGGGPTVWQKIASMANVHNVRLGHHEEPHIAMHLLASIPNPMFLEGFHPDLDPVFYEMLENTPRIEDGRLELPDGPGFGIELDMDFVNEHEITI